MLLTCCNVAPRDGADVATRDDDVPTCQIWPLSGVRSNPMCICMTTGIRGYTRKKQPILRSLLMIKSAS